MPYTVRDICRGSWYQMLGCLSLVWIVLLCNMYVVVTKFRYGSRFIHLARLVKKPITMNLIQQIIQFQSALSAEISFVKQNGSQKNYLSEGRYLGEREIEKLGTYSIYLFVTDTELGVPPDTPATITYQGQRFSAFVLSIEGFDLVLACQGKLSTVVQQTIDSAILHIDPWYLLDALKERLQELSEAIHRHRLPKLLLSQSDDVASAPSDIEEAQAFLDRLPHEALYNEAQLTAVGHVLANPVSFIWGPPGTGKSSTLGLAIAALVLRGESVLVLAHSNAAVDVGMQQVGKHLAHTNLYEQGQLIRYGFAVDQVLLDKYPLMQIRGILKSHNSELIHKFERLEVKERSLKNRAKKSSYGQRQLIEQSLKVVQEELREMRIILSNLEKSLLNEARVIGCTLSKLSVDKALRERAYAHEQGFDAVFIDEASMAYIPHVVFASSLAHRHVGIFGDFRQLPPVAQNHEHFAVQKWLERDVFEVAGIVERVDKREIDARLVMLQTQYRMHEHIAHIPNKLYYHNRLRTADVIKLGTQAIANSTPAATFPVVFVQTNKLNAYCFSDFDSHSRFNPVSALVTLAYAQEALKHGNHIGLITPYRAQARLLHKMVTELGWPTEHVKIATVHRFQGSEQDVILFDLVDGQGKKPSVLLNKKNNRQASRLVNVAISRARGKFILITDFSYVKAKYSDGSSLKKFVNKVARHSGDGMSHWLNWPEEGSKSLWHDIVVEGIQYWPYLQTCEQLLKEDIANAKEEIAVCWSHLSNREQIQKLLLARRNTITLHVTGQATEAFTHLTNVQTYRFVPQKHLNLLMLDKNIMWLWVNPEYKMGGLIRIALPQTVKLLDAFWKLVPNEKELWQANSQPEYWLPKTSVFANDAKLNDTEQIPFTSDKPHNSGHCPRCNAVLYILPNEYGQPQYTCTEGCGHQAPYQQGEVFVTEILRCKKCGSAMKFTKGRYGYFWACSKYPSCRSTEKFL